MGGLAQVRLPSHLLKHAQSLFVPERILRRKTLLPDKEEKTEEAKRSHAYRQNEAHRSKIPLRKQSIVSGATEPELVGR